MKVFIIEDEPMAQETLARTLTELFPDTVVAGTAKSVASAVAWLQEPQNKPDVIFMDVELSDGKCFEIFRQTDVTAPVIMTTAYDNYAVKAFEVNSVDYLLKPIDPVALQRAVERCKSRIQEKPLDIDKLVATLQGAAFSGPARPAFKEHLLVQFGDHLVPLSCTDIACIYSEDKLNHLVTFKGEKYMMDESLDSIAAKLDPRNFFKISRGCIVARSAVGSLTKLFGGRLRIELAGVSGKALPQPEVARSRTDEFLAWISE